MQIYVYFYLFVSKLNTDPAIKIPSRKKKYILVGTCNIVETWNTTDYNMFDSFIMIYFGFNLLDWLAYITAYWWERFICEKCSASKGLYFPRISHFACIVVVISF